MKNLNLSLVILAVSAVSSIGGASAFAAECSFSHTSYKWVNGDADIESEFAALESSADEAAKKECNQKGSDCSLKSQTRSTVAKSAGADLSATSTYVSGSKECEAQESTPSRDKDPSDPGPRYRQKRMRTFQGKNRAMIDSQLNGVESASPNELSTSAPAADPSDSSPKNSTGGGMGGGVPGDSDGRGRGHNY